MAVKVNVGDVWKEMSDMKINLDKPHFLFDGSSNGIVIGDVTTYDGLTGFTIECWVRLTLRNTVSLQGIISKGPYYSTASSFNLSLMERSASSPTTQINRLEFSVSNGYHFVNLGTDFQTNTWHHIAITLGGSSIKIYLDGVLKGSSALGVPIPNTFSSLNIGQTPDGAINGGIGEIRFWNYAKTLSQIQDQMDLELDGNEIGLLGLYQASKQTLPLTSGSNVIYDSTSTGNNGTIDTTLGDSISYDYLESSGMKINIGDVWKTVTKAYINIGDSWKQFYSGWTDIIARVLVVGGGGGGGSRFGGGGGAGGYVYISGYTITNSAITITVGTGGAGGAATGGPGTGGANNGANGNNSVFGTITAYGGGGGHYGDTGTGLSGASGGGSAGRFSSGASSSTSGQGNNGGASDGKSPYRGGGGGGSASVGGKGGTNPALGGGGAGTLNDISGTALYYAAGGGGGGSADGNTAGGAGGSSIGGNGCDYDNNPVATAGAAYTGSGGGGGAYSTGAINRAGAAGATGIVIIRYTSATQRGTGGNSIYQVGGDWVHVFTSNGTFTPA